MSSFAIAAVERALAGEDLVEHETEGVEIRLDGQLSSLELLGRHVLRRAGLRFASGDAGRRAGESEVGDLRAAAAVDHHVGGFQIAMEHALVMRGAQARAQLARDFRGLVLRQPADAPQQRRKVFAVDVFHRQEVAAFDVAKVEDAADVGMRHLQREADLIEEPLQAIGILLHVARQEFQRDGLAELQVIGAIHLAHAAAAEQADHAIPVGQNLSWHVLSAVAWRRAA